MNWSIVDKKNYEKWKDFSTVHINKLMWTWHMNPFSTNTCNVKVFTLPHAKHVVCLRTFFIFEERQLLENIQSFLNFFFSNFQSSASLRSLMFTKNDFMSNYVLTIGVTIYIVATMVRKMVFFYSKLLLMHLHQVSLIEVFWFEQS